MPPRARSKLLAGVEQNAHRTVVGGLDAHRLTEDATLDGDAAGGQQGAKLIVLHHGLLRRGCRGEGGSTTLSGVGQKGERADHQHRAPYIDHVVIQSTFAILEDSEIANLLGEIVSIFGRVFETDAEVYEQPSPDPRLTPSGYIDLS